MKPNKMHLPGAAAGRGGEEGALGGSQAGLSGTAAVLAPGPGALGRETPASSDLTQASPRPAAGPHAGQPQAGIWGPRAMANTASWHPTGPGPEMWAVGSLRRGPPPPGLGPDPSSAPGPQSTPLGRVDGCGALSPCRGGSSGKGAVDKSKSG